MNKNRHIAIIGSGPSALYLLQSLLRKREQIGDSIEEIVVFDRESEMGAGMPYSRKYADRYNICNITSEEIPKLDVSFAEWLRSIDAASRRALGVDEAIRETATYPRIALGAYFVTQWRSVCARLRLTGINVIENPSHEVVDLIDDNLRDVVLLKCAQSEWAAFDRVVLATGHQWKSTDRPDAGYFASPWPIHKLLPKNGETISYPVGILGASLSAFDVVTSLAHRHGQFIANDGEMRFIPNTDCVDFKLVMHTASGLLPQLQYEQREAYRDIYRHVRRDELQSLMDRKGFLRLGVYFDRVCRPALIKAFQRDKRFDMVKRLNQPEFNLRAFIDQMTSEHDYRDPFAGMRKEMRQAEDSVEKDRPVHWKEVIDDLMYTLNFHAERMPAEDHETLHSLVMPFLMNVIAAMPLESARILLALHDAGCIEVVEGHAEVSEGGACCTTVSVDRNGSKTLHRYKMFVDCSGQKAVDVGDYPFESLVKAGTVRAARVPFAEKSTDRVDVVESLQVGGIDVDPTYRVVGVDQKPNPRIYDLAFPHTAGLRPYSYGLQACAETARIVVDSWCAEIARSLKPHALISR